MRWLAVILTCLALNAQETQTPKFQPNWPCTGKEPSFDPTYAKVSEASGGQLFLFDRSEAARSGVLMIGTTRHPETVLRSAGKLETPYADIQIPVDSTIESLFVSVSLQCMQRIILYDPQSREADPVLLKGEDTWFRAGRIATLPQPQPGIWTLRLMGAGPYFVSIKAKTRIGLHSLTFEDVRPRLGANQKVSLWLPLPAVQFQLVNALGEPLQSLVLDADPSSPTHWTGLVIPAFKEFRVSVSGADEQGYKFLRTDPRLFEAR